MPRMNHTASGPLGLAWCAATFLSSLLTVYVAAYFCVVCPGMTGMTVGWLGWPATPDYLGLPEVLFRPIQYCDRSFLRPAKWSSYSQAAITISVIPAEPSPE